MSSRSDPARGTPGSKTSSVPSHCWPAAGRRPGTVPKPFASDTLSGVKQIPLTLCNMLAIKSQSPFQILIWACMSARTVPEPSELHDRQCKTGSLEKATTCAHVIAYRQSILRQM